MRGERQLGRPSDFVVIPRKLSRYLLSGGAFIELTAATAAEEDRQELS